MVISIIYNILWIQIVLYKIFTILIYVDQTITAVVTKLDANEEYIKFSLIY